MLTAAHCCIMCVYQAMNCKRTELLQEIVKHLAGEELTITYTLQKCLLESVNDELERLLDEILSRSDFPVVVVGAVLQITTEMMMGRELFKLADLSIMLNILVTFSLSRV